MSNDRDDSQFTEEQIPDDIVSLAEEYLRVVARQENNPTADTETKDLDELREEIEYWEQELEQLEGGDDLYKIAVEEKESLEDRIAEREQKGNYRECVQQRFIERAGSEFVARDEWHQDSVVRAVTHASIGEEREVILLDDYRIPEADPDSRATFVLSQNVRALVSHRTGDERMAKLWEKIEDTRQNQITEVLAHSSEPLGPSGIAERLNDEGTDRRHISATLSDVRDKKYHPFHRSDGNYELSLVGEFLWREFGSNEETDDEDSDANEGSPDSDLSDF